MLFRRALAHFPKSSLALAIPEPRGLPLVGTSLSLLLQGAPRLHLYVDRRHRQLGPVFRDRLGPVAAVFVADPAAIRAVFAHEGRHPRHALPDAWLHYNRLQGCRRGLFFMDGERWWHHRRILNRLLLKNPGWIEPACERVADRLLAYLAADGFHPRLEAALYRWSLDAIVAVLLGADAYARLPPEIHHQVADLAEVVHLVFETTSKLSLIPAALAAKLNIPRWRRFVQAVDAALSGADCLVDELVKSPGEGLLSRLLQEDVEPEDVRRIIVDLVLAAGDTTAYALQWMLYCVAKKRGLQQEMREDAGLARLVFKEALRLYPVAPFLTRILPEDAVLGGYCVPKDTLVVMSIYTSGRDERFFKEPHAFEPRRWDRGGEGYNSGMQQATLPFAMGLRACVGRKIAEVQLHTALQKVVNAFELELGNRREVEIALKMVAVPAEPIRLRFRPL